MWLPSYNEFFFKSFYLEPPGTDMYCDNIIDVRCCLQNYHM